MLRPCRLAQVALAVCLGATGSAQGQRWSPDGTWIAYVHSDTPAVDVASNARLSWLLGVPQPKAQFGTHVERLWAHRTSSGEAVLLDEVEGHVTEPSWLRNGTGLVYGRYVDAASPGAAARFEVVFQDDISQRRVVRAWTWPETPPPFDDRARWDVALSHDGSRVTAPMLKPAGLVVLRMDNGEAVAELPGASRPAWSPDGRLAYYVDSNALVISQSGGKTEAARVSLEGSAEGLPATRWSNDGKTLYLLTRDASKAVRFERMQLTDEGTLARKEGSVEIPDGGDRARSPLTRLSFGLDHDEQELFVGAFAPGRDAVINWIRTRGDNVYKRLNPLSEMLPLDALVVSPRPSSMMLAFRPSVGDAALPPGLSDPDKESFEPCIPDEAARVAWIDLTLSGIERLMVSAVPGDDEATRGLRPTRLLGPNQLEPQDPAQVRILRLARLGRSAARRAIPESGSSGSTRIRDPWTLLIFDYLCRDFSLALRRLDSLELTTDDPDARLRLLGLRCQILMGLDRLDAAVPVLEYLEAVSAVRERAAKTAEERANAAIRWLGPLREAVDARLSALSANAPRSSAFDQSTE